MMAKVSALRITLPSGAVCLYSRSEVDINLLFYRGLKSLVAIELKIGEFEAEYAGKMQLNLTAFDEQVKLSDENPSIGIIICKSKDKTYVQYPLKQTNVPIGIAAYWLSNILPEDMKAMLSEPEEIAKKVSNL